MHPFLIPHKWSSDSSEIYDYHIERRATCSKVRSLCVAEMNRRLVSFTAEPRVPMDTLSGPSPYTSAIVAALGFVVLQSIDL